MLIRKDITDNKVFKKEFYTKETRKKGIDKIKSCKFQFILLELIRESVRETKFFEFENFSFLFFFFVCFVEMFQSFLNLSIFLFFFCFVEMFQSSFNCKSSIKFSSAEFSVEFSFSRLTW